MLYRADLEHVADLFPEKLLDSAAGAAIRSFELTEDDSLMRCGTDLIVSIANVAEQHSSIGVTFPSRVWTCGTST